MINIAVCDDDHAVLKKLSQFFDQYGAERRFRIEHTDFCSPLELMASIERGMRYDILFLDVLMPGENGIETAAEIRSYDSNVKIIFLTSSAEFAVESYTVDAFYYQLKPIERTRFFKLMDAVLSACERERLSGLILRCKNGITRIEARQVEYCEVIHRTLFIHLTTGKVLEKIGSMDELSDQLMPLGNFLRPHRSYLINLDYVQSLSFRAITMSCLAEIPIPRGKYNEIKDAYLAYAFQNREVML